LNQAGCALERDLAGSTCDALAHWDLQASREDRVLVDIQGEI
jgi:hypothetical protein